MNSLRQSMFVAQLPNSVYLCFAIKEEKTVMNVRKVRKDRGADEGRNRRIRGFKKYFKEKI